MTAPPVNSSSPSSLRAAVSRFGAETIAIVGLATIYFGAARLGLLLASVHGNVSPVWPATGVAIGGLLLGGQRRWPGVLLGAILANVLTTVPWLVAVGIGIGNTLEAVVGAWLARRLPEWLRRLELDELAAPAGFMVAAVVAPTVSASCGVLILALGGTLAGAVPGTLWWTWWVGDAIGALLVVPLVVSVHEAWRARERPTPRGLACGLAVFLAAAAVCWLVFFRAEWGAFLFAVFPVLLLAVAWLGSGGVKVTALLISALALSAAFFGSGPFTSGTLNENLLHLQLFLASVAMVALLLPGFRAAGNLLLPGGILLVAWTVSGWLFAALHADRRRADEGRLDARIAAAETSVRQRLAAYVDALHGARALLSATRSVGRAEWQAYAESLRLEERYPGVTGLGAVFPVRPAEAPAFVQRRRAEGAEDFTIRPVPGVPGANAAPPAEHFVLTYLEPLAANRTAPGLDLATEVNRRTAAELARDRGEPWITAPIPLVQDARRRPGFILFLPVYQPRAPIATVAERRAALVAWVDAAFITERLLATALADFERDLRVHAFHGTAAERPALAYASSPTGGGPPTFERVTHLDLVGQTFTFGWNRGPGFVPTGVSEAVWAATSSALLSLLIAGLVISIQKVGRRAHAIAAERTTKLVASEARLRVQNEELARLHKLELDEKISARLAEETARLEMLRYQLNPHFLFNSLASIRSQIPAASADARENVERLAQFCRLTLHGRGPDEASTLGGELALLRVYLDIEQTRLRDLLSVAFEVDPAAEPMSLPRMLLLPLVENAIKYGHATNPDRLRLRIAARREKGSRDALVIEVANSGRWLQPAVARTVPSLGIGLANVRERLQRTYPEAHDLTTEERDGWVIVRLRLTLQEDGTRTLEDGKSKMEESGYTLR